MDEHHFLCETLELLATADEFNVVDLRSVEVRGVKQQEKALKIQTDIERHSGRQREGQSKIQTDRDRNP